jgi:N6-adenosine-specific RNA methylase IME4
VTESTVSFPDPKGVTLAQAREVVAQATAIRAWCRDNGDIGTAEEARRRLAAFEQYISDRKLKKELEEQIRRFEALIGEFLGPRVRGRPTNPNDVRINELHDPLKDAFRLLAEWPDVVDEMLASGQTSRAAIIREIRKREIEANPASEPSGLFRTLVVDPPWPMVKIDREVRPNQMGEMGFDYPTMTVDKLAMLPLDEWAEPDSHLYLWTTHKYLPDALYLAEAWGFKYQCLMTWVKNVGITPYSWMYSTEHVLFCRRGNLDLLALGKRLDFHAPVAGHSVKPDVFYELVEQVSPGPRIDVFARRERDGWATYGNEVAA